MRLSRVALPVALVLAALAGSQAAHAAAACPSPDTLGCQAIVDELDAHETRLGAIESSLASIDADTPAPAGEVTIEDGATVELGPATTDRLELAWAAGWATVGVLLWLICAPLMQRAFRWLRE